MGMTIDTVTKWLGIIRANLKVYPEVGSDKKIESLDTAISYLKDLEMYQLDYNARLKADMVDMLTEILLEIEELETGGDAWELAIKDDCKKLIQQKIDKLKEVEE